MRWHFHKWGKWEDARAEETFTYSVMSMLTREAIIQRRRCEVCNIIQERRP